MKRFVISFVFILILTAGLCVTVSAADRPFLDVKEGSWYEESTQYCYTYGYMCGTAEGRFSPGDNLTRAMAVQLLYAINNDDTDYSEVKSFEDVSLGAWYHTAVEWAYDMEIVKGTGKGSFSPNANVTRQDFYVMLHNYSAAFSHYKEKEINDSYLWYEDNDKIADYAIDALNWAGCYGFLSGYEDNTLKPAAFITRAEITSVMKRFDSVLGHKWSCNEMKQRSCTEDGYGKFVCSDCPQVKEVTYKKGHVRYLFSSTAGTCISKGTDEYRCLNCALIKSVSNRYGDHSFSLTEIIPSTRTKQGYSVYTCIYCGGTNHRDYTAPLGRTEGWDSNYDGKLTIDEFFGAYDIVQFLSEHKSDYVGTPYVSLKNYMNEPWKLLRNRGQYPNNAGMNCTGFVASVVSRCGGNLGRITKAGSGSYANAYNWLVTVNQNKIYHYTFYSISDALKSGVMKKGDIVLFIPPNVPKDTPENQKPDFHFGIYWGDYSGHDVFWHSTGATSYNWNAGVRGMKNQITRMASGTKYATIYVFPMQGE